MLFDVVTDELCREEHRRRVLGRLIELRGLHNSSGGGVLGGLGGLLNKLQQGGLGNAANSWVGSGQNQPAPPDQLGSALGPNILKTLAQQSGLSEDELTKQLSQVLPGLVDKLTPNGRLPTMAELSNMMEQQ